MATLLNKRAGTDISMTLALTSDGVRIDFSELADIHVFVYNDKHRVMAGRCQIQAEGDQLHALSPADNQRYLGPHRVVLSCVMDGRKATFDAPAFNLVATSAEVNQQGLDAGEEYSSIGIDLVVEEISSSLIRELVDAAINATAAANDAAAEASAQAEAAEAAASAVGEAIQDANDAAMNANAAAADAREAIEHLDADLEDLKQNKANTEGHYPLLQVGFADDLAGHGESVPAEFSFRASGGKSIKDGIAWVKRIKGNSVVWNQKIKGFAAWNLQGGTIEGNEVVWSASNRTGALNAYSNTFAQHTTHKYLISADVTASSTNVGLGMYYTGFLLVHHSGSGRYERLAVITNGKGDGIDACYLTDTSTSGFGEIRAKNYRCIDLTQMFGAGNEPSTIEEYEARKPIVANENAYNEGEVIHMNVDSIKSVGDNAWDEQWEEGTYNLNTGEKTSSSGYICSSNLSMCLPNEKYYIKTPKALYVLWYDNSKNYISYIWASNNIIQAPSNATYFAFRTVNGGDLTTYNNDITISLYHSGWKAEVDNVYKPYWEDTLPLPVIRKYFPDGMKKAGTAHDEIRFNKASGKWEKVVRIGSVDMADLTLYYNTDNEGYFYGALNGAAKHSSWALKGNLLSASYAITNANAIASSGVTPVDKTLAIAPNGNIYIVNKAYTDVASFKAAMQMQDVILYYELAEPIVTELDAEDQNFRDYYNVADFGTEQAISETQSAPFNADTIYQFNAVDMIRENYNTIQEILARLTAAGI